MSTPNDPHRSDPAAPAAGAPEDRVRPALGAMIRLFCARFMPEVLPEHAAPDDARPGADAPEDLH